MSKGGRLVLVKNILSSLPTYFMSLFVLLVSVRDRLEKLERDFLWEGNSEEHKYHLVKWGRVCDRVQNGGLSIKDLKML